MIIFQGQIQNLQIVMKKNMWCVGTTLSIFYNKLHLNISSENAFIWKKLYFAILIGSNIIGSIECILTHIASFIKS
jgi:hypothetical protein